VSLVLHIYTVHVHSITRYMNCDKVLFYSVLPFCSGLYYLDGSANTQTYITLLNSSYVLNSGTPWSSWVSRFVYLFYSTSS